MRLLLPLAAMAVFPAYSQFANLSTTDDGGVIYFSTRLRPTGSSDSTWPKVYRLDGGGFQLAGQASAAPGGSLETGGWMVEGASVSGNGGAVAIHSRTVCRIGTACINRPLEFSEIRTSLGSQRILGIAEISRSGRYASTWRRTGFGPVPTPEVRLVHRLDLETGARVPVGSAPAEAGKWIGADGTILVGGWQLVTPAGGTIPIGPQPMEVYRAILAANTAMVVYQAKAEPSAIRVRVRTGADILLTETGTSPTISADSQKVLYLAPSGGKIQAFLWEGAGARQVTNEPEGLTEAVLSGTTGLAVAVTGADELITVDVRNGYRSEYIGKSPEPGPYPLDLFSEPDPVYPAQAAGSSYAIFGSRLADSAGGVRVFVNGTEAAVGAVTPEAVSYQVHWETRESEPNERPAVSLRRGNGAFELALSLRSVSKTLPAFISLGSEVNPPPFSSTSRPLYAIHGDWRGMVRRGDPAEEGEYVHLYATGLGPVSPAVATGEAGPASPPSALSSPIPCEWIGDAVERADVAFAGLAPGLVGIYQVTVRMRDKLTIPGPTEALSCFGGAAVAPIAVRVTP